jgi:archaellum component FlaG (FlaF/FlaG flagellin family)
MSQPRTYQLLIKNTQEPCILTELTVEIAIAGFLCKTSVTMVFKNPTDNETEGEVTYKSPYVFVFNQYNNHFLQYKF